MESYSNKTIRNYFLTPSNISLFEILINGKIVVMLDELRQTAINKFCSYAGQTTCSTLSNLGSTAMSYPFALSTIGAIGLSTLVFLQWSRKTTVVSPNTIENKEIVKEASQIVEHQEEIEILFEPIKTVQETIEDPVYELQLKEFKERTPSEEHLRKRMPVLLITNGLTLEDGSAIIHDPEESVVQLFLYNYVRTPENPFGYIKWKELHSIYPGIIELRIPMSLWLSWNEFQSISLRYKGNLIKVNFQFTQLINLNEHS